MLRSTPTIVMAYYAKGNYISAMLDFRRAERRAERYAIRDESNTKIYKEHAEMAMAARSKKRQNNEEKKAPRTLDFTDADKLIELIDKIKVE